MKRLNKHQTTITLVTVLLGFLLATAVRIGSSDGLLANARESDLVVLLDSLTQRLSRLQSEERDLLEARREILSGSDAAAAARTREELEALQILNGSVAVSGPGVNVTLRDPSRSVSYDIMVSLIQELRDAGAEAMEINGVRLNGRSFVSTTDSGKLAISGTTIAAPYTLKAIGEGKTLAVALQIPGGVSDTVSSIGGTLLVEESDEVIITTTVPQP